jgi:hypothetical protein
MHNRQSGAAHVPIMFFLLLLVMFLGALGFAWVTLNRNGELQKSTSEARAEADVLRKKSFLVEHYIEDIGRVIGKPGKYEGRQGSAGIYAGATLDYAGVMNPAEVKAILDKACGDAGVSIATGLENVLGAMVTRVSQMQQRVKDVESERDKVLTEKAEVDRKFQAATTDTANKVRELAQNLEQARSDFEGAKQNKDGQITQLQDTVRNRNDEVSATKEAATAKEKELNGEIRKHQMQNSALVARAALQNPLDVADGKVIVARNSVATAFINLGKKDMLQPGTIFRVRNPSKEEVKGYATVTRVEDERAEVSLSGIVEPVGDWVREGDLIYNEFYTSGVSRTIYLMGRFSAPYHKPELATLLKRLGNKVVDKMGPGVDTVILGDDPVNEAGDGFDQISNSQEYKDALDLRVEFANLRKVRDLIKL